MKLRRLLSLLAPLALVAGFSGACTTHGEGGRCNQKLTGNDDCASGLVCTAASEIALPDSGGTLSGADICCPQDRTQSTTDICKFAPVTPGSDASIPDGGTPDTGASDATTDQTSGDASDAADDGATADAPDDAPDGD